MSSRSAGMLLPSRKRLALCRPTSGPLAPHALCRPWRWTTPASTWSATWPGQRWVEWRYRDVCMKPLAPRCAPYCAPYCAPALAPAPQAKLVVVCHMASGLRAKLQQAQDARQQAGAPAPAPPWQKPADSARGAHGVAWMGAGHLEQHPARAQRPARLLPLQSWRACVWRRTGWSRR